MTLNYASFYGDNEGSPDTAHQYGPYNLGSCSKLLRVEAQLALTLITTGSQAPNVVQEFPCIWGVHWVAHGASPLALPAYAFDQQFLWAELAVPSGISNLSWDYTSPDGAVSIAYSSHAMWRGQRPIGEDIDLYLTTGSTLGSGGEFQGSFVMRVINTT